MTKHRDRYNHDNIILLLVATMIAGVLATIVVLGTSARADAAQTQGAQPQGAPYGGCEEVLQDYPAYIHTEGAQWCRKHGWTLRPNVAISPRHVLRYYNLPSCKYEDGSGQRATCGWNVTTGDGNGRGLVYIAFTINKHRDFYHTLNKCDANGCHYWRR